jgi:hypothetical protein
MNRTFISFDRKSLSALLILAGATVSSAAQAEDWRFCIAADYGAHRAFVSNLFDSDANRESLEDWFEGVLAERGITHIVAQCPIGGARHKAERAYAYAKEFNLDFGLSFDRIATVGSENPPGLEPQAPNQPDVGDSTP